MDAAHQAATLAVEVGEDFLFECGLVEVTGSDGDAEGNGFLFGFAGDILEYSDGGVDAAAFAEEGADGSTRALGGDEDDVDVCGDVDLGEVFKDGGEAVGEVQCLEE